MKNRWLIAASAVAVHLSMGSAYSYSVYKVPLSEQLGWSGRQVQIAFIITVFVLGLSAALFGRFIERFGPRKSVFLAAGLFAVGLVGAGCSVLADSLLGFYLFYGVVGGVGLGIGYLAPIPTLVKWFPDRRGLATGMAVFGFGCGALLAGPLAVYLMASFGIGKTMFMLAALYLLLMSAAAAYLAPPPEGWMPAQTNAEQQSVRHKANRNLPELNAREAVRTARFWLLWFIMFANICCGISLISVASPLAQEFVGMSSVAATGMVGLMGLFNGGGRIGWATLSDYTGRINLFILFFVLQLSACLLFPAVMGATMMQLLVFFVISMYGGGFAILPALVGDLFGTKQLGIIQGYLMTSWSVAGVVGPLTIASIREVTGSYAPTFYWFAGLFACALLVALVLRRNIGRIASQS